MAAQGPLVQCLWIGERLSSLELLCLHSHLAQGHTIHLYSYSEIANLPSGVTITSGEEILPRDAVFCYQRGAGRGSYSGFSNLFRYALLYRRGGWWTDLDVVCLRPFRFPEDYVLAEQIAPEEERVNGHVLKVPTCSPLMEYCLQRSLAADPAALEWGAIGPRLLTRAVSRLDLFGFVRPSDLFSPISCHDIRKLFRDSPLPESCYAVHLFHEMWRRRGLRKDKRYRRSSLIERWKERFLPEEARPRAGLFSRRHRRQRG